MKHLPSKHIAFLMLIGLLFTACNETSTNNSASSDTSSSTSTPEAQKPAAPVSAPWSVSLSSEAKEVASLLDKESYNAADTLLNKYIQNKPNDAGLYCQYVRFLISAYDFSQDPFISNPIRTDDKYRVFAVAQQAAKLAVEFDPDVKSYLAEIILKEIYDEVYDHAQNKQGFLSPNTGSNDRIDLAWAAIEYDPKVAKKWAPKYESLVPVFINKGMPGSALWVANLASDLGTEAQGDMDFEKATQAFKATIARDNYDPKSVEPAIDRYLNVFADDCKRVLNSNNANYIGLLKTLRSKGISLEKFEKQDLIPPSVRGE